MKMDIVIDREADSPLYRQISRQIIEAVCFGKLSPNDQLPTLRALAELLHVNIHTIRHAYQILKCEGIITITQGRGAFVSAAMKGKQTIKESVRWLRSKIYGFITEAKREGLKLNNADKLIKTLEILIFPKTE